VATLFSHHRHSFLSVGTLRRVIAAQHHWLQNFVPSGFVRVTVRSFTQRFIAVMTMQPKPIL
jgi:hypothetical protein